MHNYYAKKPWSLKPYQVKLLATFLLWLLGYIFFSYGFFSNHESIIWFMVFLFLTNFCNCYWTVCLLVHCNLHTKDFLATAFHIYIFTSTLFFWWGGCIPWQVNTVSLQKCRTSYRRYLAVLFFNVLCLQTMDTHYQYYSVTAVFFGTKV